jgi:hypothetical protein
VLDTSHEDAKGLVILEILKDPSSAWIRFGTPTRGVAYSHGEQVLAWFSSVCVNAKNLMVAMSEKNHTPSPIDASPTRSAS